MRLPDLIYLLAVLSPHADDQGKAVIFQLSLINDGVIHLEHRFNRFALGADIENGRFQCVFRDGAGVEWVCFDGAAGVMNIDPISVRVAIVAWLEMLQYVIAAIGEQGQVAGASGGNESACVAFLQLQQARMIRDVYAAAPANLSFGVDATAKVKIELQAFSLPVTHDDNRREWRFRCVIRGYGFYG
ncbi:hypothetical protein CR512_19235 [Pseudomonas putida]|nr:hypothetical protein CR512_19235 [Pseudomonas putida]